MMALSQKPTDDRLIFDALQAGIRKEAERVFEEQKAEMIKKFDESKDDVIARIALRISEHMSIQHIGTAIRIEIVKVKDNAPRL